jgi:biotin transport system ATP-binding protein
MILNKEIIQIEKVFLSRDMGNVLNGISLQLFSRRIGIIGNNGSGKSSLVRLFNGLLKPDSGSVIVHGINTIQNPRSLPSLVGFVFQNPDHQIIFPTVGEELMFGLLQTNVPKKDAEKRVFRILEDHSIRNWFEMPTHYLSEGQKHLLCILSVLVMNPKVIIIDEALTNIDMPTRHQLLEIINGLKQQVVLISHDLDVFKNFDYVIWLDQGLVEMEGPPKAVVDAYKTACLGSERSSL